MVMLMRGLLRMQGRMIPHHIESTMSMEDGQAWSKKNGKINIVWGLLFFAISVALFWEEFARVFEGKGWFVGFGIIVAVVAVYFAGDLPWILKPKK